MRALWKVLDKIKLKNRKGQKYTLREFLRQWKEGMEHVTPLQQSKVAQWGMVISGIGIVWGIIFSLRIGYHWMGVILIGGFIVLSTQFLGNWQKKQALQRHEDAYKLADIEQVEVIASGD